MTGMAEAFMLQPLNGCIISEHTLCEIAQHKNFNQCIVLRISTINIGMPSVAYFCSTSIIPLSLEEILKNL